MNMAGDKKVKVENPASVFIAAAAALAPVLLVFFLSDMPHQFADPDESLLRISIKRTGKRLVECDEKKLLEEERIGKILAFQYHMGQYLPDWHRWEDYRQVYFSKKATGACREMFCFELIWLNYLIGSEVKEVRGDIAKLSDLDMDADDTVTAAVT